MPIHVCGVLCHIQRRKCIFVYSAPRQKLHSSSDLSPRWSGRQPATSACSVNQPSCLPHRIGHFIPPLDPGPSLARPNPGSQLLAPSESRPPHLPSQCPADRASVCPPATLLPACPPCQGLTFEQRAAVPNVMHRLICAEFPDLCPNWHCLQVLWKFFTWMLLTLCVLMGPALLTFSWSSIAAFSLSDVTQSMKPARICLCGENHISPESPTQPVTSYALSFALRWRFFSSTNVNRSSRFWFGLRMRTG